MNGLTLLALLALAIGVVAAYLVGAMHGRRERRPAVHLAPAVATAPVAPLPPASIEIGVVEDLLGDECARIVRSYEAEAWSLRQALASRDTEDQRHCVALSDARAEAARYRQLVVDLENNAPPPLLDAPGSPDDLKLIVGIGPVLERMLQQLGVGTYRQIARWSERDIDAFDAKLAEFPGRIRRDAWVTQARELHQSKFGERP